MGMFKTAPVIKAGGTQLVFTCNEGPHALTADEVFAWAANLVSYRADMKPPVPSAAPSEGMVATPDAMHFLPDMLEGGLIAVFRDPAMGWLKFRVPPEKLADLRLALQNASGPPPLPTRPN